MRIDAGPAQSRSHALRLPLTVCLALLLGGAVIGVGGALAIHHYLQTSRIVFDATASVFTRMGRESALALEGTTAPAKLLVEVLAVGDVATAANLDTRMRHLPPFAEALRRNPALSALYVGYGDGSFFLVRPLRDAAIRATFEAPADATFTVQSVEARAGGPARAQFIHLRDDLSVIAAADRPDFAFDPRTREWYKLAIASGREVLTAPYVFFTTREPGITFARKSASGASVVGADITLASLTGLLRRQAVTPSTELFLLTSNGVVVAQSGAASITRAADNGSLRLAALAEIPAATAAALGARRDSDATAATFEFTAAAREWVGAIKRIQSGSDSPFYLAMASPVDELLLDARRMREQSFWVTLALIAFAIPLAWLLASRVSRPLRRIASEALAIQALDFTEAPAVHSRVHEVDSLAAAVRASRTSLRHFQDISGALAAERSVERLIARVLDETMQLAGADAASVHLVDAKRRTLEAARAIGGDSAETNRTLAPMPLDAAAPVTHPLARAVLDGTTLLVDVARDDPRNRNILPIDALPQGPANPAMLATPLRDRTGGIIGVLCLLFSGARAADIRPHVVAFVEKLSGVAAISIETQRLLAEQKALLEAFIQLVAAAIDAKSPYTGGHCQRVPELTRLLAQAACDARDGPFRDFRLSEDEWEAVHIASWLHDCGKVTTPEYVVDKATKLETLYDRIHEVRMRFEVLKRDAEIASLKARLAGGDGTALSATLEREWRELDDDFAFIATCNQGGESMDAAAIERVQRIAARTWQRTLDDRIGLSWEERARKERRPAQPLPATEPLLADAPEHVIERGEHERIPRDNRWGFALDVPDRRYDRGEIHNLTVARGTLTREERYAINDHIVQTIIMLDNLPFPRHLANVPELAGGHHETMDGRGYPRRLTRAQMSPVARMIAIADIFEALTAVDRPYKKGKTLSESLRIMARMRDERHIDPDLFELFLTSGVYRQYAAKHLTPAQLDDVDVAAFLRRPDSVLETA
ncbi:MAG TPA: HD domain-containing phosphohydrolase [Casimicrobiaceae bacterium]|nr:HD domain-containing phosphohydrolase [Casimicrobiaceae bacterium]